MTTCIENNDGYTMYMEMRAYRVERLHLDIFNLNKSVFSFIMFVNDRRSISVPFILSVYIVFIKENAKLILDKAKVKLKEVKFTKRL